METLKSWGAPYRTYRTMRPSEGEWLAYDGTGELGQLIKEKLHVLLSTCLGAFRSGSTRSESSSFGTSTLASHLPSLHSWF